MNAAEVELKLFIIATRPDGLPCAIQAKTSNQAEKYALLHFGKDATVRPATEAEETEYFATTVKARRKYATGKKAGS